MFPCPLDLYFDDLISKINIKVTCVIMMQNTLSYTCYELIEWKILFLGVNLNSVSL